MKEKLLVLAISGRFGSNWGSAYTSISPRVYKAVGKMHDPGLKPVTKKVMQICERWS